MVYSLRLYFLDKWVFVPLLLSLVVLAYMAAHLATHVHPTPEPIFLHYSIFFGIDYIGQWWKLWFLWGIGLIFLLVNNIVAWLLYSLYRIPARFLAVSTLVAEIFLNVGLYFIIRINS